MPDDRDDLGKTGTLWVVATPLGNLEDLSARAIQVLRRVDCIACEDTRRTAHLLARHGLATPTIACHRFNERRTLDSILKRLREGADVALVSDGGTPCVSDPGALLVSTVLDAGFQVAPVPGPCAAVTLLSAGGLPADRFVFEGFLPHRAGERRRRLRALRSETRTAVLYEAPHRLRETLADLASIFGERAVVLGREITKIHETILRGTAATILDSLGDGDVRGECTLLVAGCPEDEVRSNGEDDAETRRVRDAWRECLSEAEGDRRDALRRAARRLGIRRPDLWRRLQELGERDD